MVTRFVPGGYQPEHAGEPTAEKVRRAVEGLGDLMDDYEFHYPGELTRTTSTRCATRSTGTASTTVCTGSAPDPRFGKGGLTSPDAAVRAEARRLTRETAEFAGAVGAQHDLLARDRGLQLPVPDAVRASRGRGSSTGSAEAAEHLRQSTASSSSSSTRTPSRR